MQAHQTRDRNLRAFARYGTYGASVLVALTLAVGLASAGSGSPHFVGTPSVVKNPDFSLTATFKAAGLANTVTNIFLTSTDVVGTLQCQNPGGNNPPPKGFNFGPLEGPTVSVAPHNGQVSASPTIGPPQLPSASSFCPGGTNTHWTIVILSLSYEGVVLHVQQNGNDVLTHDFGTVDP